VVLASSLQAGFMCQCQTLYCFYENNIFGSGAQWTTISNIFLLLLFENSIYYATRVFKSQLDLENNNEDGRFIQGQQFRSLYVVFCKVEGLAYQLFLVLRSHNKMLTSIADPSCHLPQVQEGDQIRQQSQKLVQTSGRLCAQTRNQ
jgi:hypothetical protein